MYVVNKTLQLRMDFVGPSYALQAQEAAAPFVTVWLCRLTLLQWTVQSILLNLYTAVLVRIGVRPAIL